MSRRSHAIIMSVSATAAAVAAVVAAVLNSSERKMDAATLILAIVAVGWAAAVTVWAAAIIRHDRRETNR